MTEAQTILKMIETVGPADTAKLDEIDAFVHKLTGPHVSISTDFHGNPWPDCPRRYTRSRDALKAIRPKGWFIHIVQHSGNVWFGVSLSRIRAKFETGPLLLPTEELAELHAIIQAIEYGTTNTS